MSEDNKSNGAVAVPPAAGTGKRAMRRFSHGEFTRMTLMLIEKKEVFQRAIDEGTPVAKLARENDVPEGTFREMLDAAKISHGQEYMDGRVKAAERAMGARWEVLALAILQIGDQLGLAFNEVRALMLFPIGQDREQKGAPAGQVDLPLAPGTKVEVPL